MTTDITTTSRQTSILSGDAITPDLMTRWVTFIDAKPRTIDTYTHNLKQFFLWLQSHDIVRPVREDIILYRDNLKEDHKPTTVQAYITAVKLFFQWTEQEGIYPDVAKRIKGARLDADHKKDYMTAAQVHKILASIDTSTLTGKRDYAMLCLMVTAGLRTIEIIRADIADIRARGDYTALYVQGKGHDEKNTFVKLADPVEAAIRDYLAARGKAADNEPLFVSHANRNAGERMTTRSVRRIAKDILIAAGFNSDRLTAHSFRHTAATLNLLNGASLEETQQLLRHTSINTTMIYSHALERAKNNSESRIANAIFG